MLNGDEVEPPFGGDETVGMDDHGNEEDIGDGAGDPTTADDTKKESSKEQFYHSLGGATWNRK